MSFDSKKSVLACGAFAACCAILSPVSEADEAESAPPLKPAVCLADPLPTLTLARQQALDERIEPGLTGWLVRIGLVCGVPR